MTTSVSDCNFETLLALADQMPRERFEQLRTERPDFDRWLTQRFSRGIPRSTLLSRR